MEIHKYEELKNIPADYDSPFRFVRQMTDSIAQFTDDGVMKAVINAGFNIDKDKLVSALAQDKERYDTAYRKGYCTGYKKREEEIVMCKDCVFSVVIDKAIYCDNPNVDRMIYRRPDWYCADGKQKEVSE